MQIRVGLGPRVLLRHAGTELHVGAHRFSEPPVSREARLVQRFQIQRHEALPLLVGDLQMSANIDDVLKADVASEAVGPAERLRSERG